MALRPPASPYDDPDEGFESDASTPPLPPPFSPEDARPAFGADDEFDTLDDFFPLPKQQPQGAASVSMALGSMSPGFTVRALTPILRSQIRGVRKGRCRPPKLRGLLL